METSLPVFLLALLVIRGLSLECEECIGIDDCSGDKLPCGLGKDKCSVTNMALPIGLSVTIKSCVSSDVCDKGVQVINLGQRKHLIAHLRCCEGDGCRDIPPSISELPKKATENGKQCPACLAIQGTCDEKVIDCSEDELYCAGGLIVTSTLEFSLKGCANKAFCDSLVAYEAMAPENNGHHAIQCTSNSSIHQEEFSNFTRIGKSSGVVNTNPRWFGLFITIFSGLIFFQV
ncbi:phospholipase A2 inhibitor subunit gamma B-like isoform X1 [Crotalus tigris]|uniref:phospholipase A2 inhibitor subunit gamma B-like isoform X1 n=1 Tax=Crotalus tigris TaxID=88082 RepID=UPI00192F991E|nr:phospholipase A2 inhibitor subunit gamma B-like isoform X1 [Crotalus tigris]